ncbi:MAG: hypothetical protein IKJ91_06530, partial [Clostridia bacterium]|nr:hypothetical protein [Clostridia bacterium]
KFHVETQINNNKNSLFQSFDRPFLKGRASRRRRRSPPQRRNSLTDKLLFIGKLFTLYSAAFLEMPFSKQKSAEKSADFVLFYSRL